MFLFDQINESESESESSMSHSAPAIEPMLAQYWASVADGGPVFLTPLSCRFFKCSGNLYISSHDLHIVKLRMPMNVTRIE